MSATRISIVTAQDVSSESQSANFAVQTGTMGDLFLNLDYTSGTVYVWLEASHQEVKSATEFFDLAPDVVLVTSTGTTAGTLRAVDNGDSTRNIIDGATADQKVVARFRHLPAGTYRLHWKETGTTVGTLTADMVVK